MEKIMSRGAFATMLARVTLPIIAKRKMYQPVYLGGQMISKGGRESMVRWEQVEKVIDAQQIKSVVDLGCAEGFFVRKSAEKGCFAVGVEGDARMLLWAQTTLTMDGLKNFGFIKMDMANDNIHNVPKADMVIFFSVLHHIMYSKGEEYAFEFLKKVKALTGRVMIFEMGQSNETNQRWAKRMPDMGADPHQWIIDFLKRAGFSKVDRLCEAEAYNDKTMRVVLAAYV
jgi:cyclopropane fatty-acyl-phospholipid synthase-like methyltransferase